MNPTKQYELRFRLNDDSIDIASFRRLNSCLKTPHQPSRDSVRYVQTERQGTPYTNSRRSSVPKDWRGIQPPARTANCPGPGLPSEVGHNPQLLIVLIGGLQNVERDNTPNRPFRRIHEFVKPRSRLRRFRLAKFDPFHQLT